MTKNFQTFALWMQTHQHSSLLDHKISFITQSVLILQKHYLQGTGHSVIAQIV